MTDLTAAREDMIALEVAEEIEYWEATYGAADKDQRAHIEADVRYEFDIEWSDHQQNRER